MLNGKVITNYIFILNHELKNSSIINNVIYELKNSSKINDNNVIYNISSVGYKINNDVLNFI